MLMEFIKWKQEVKYWLVKDHKLVEAPSLIENYRFFRNDIPPRDAAVYLSNIIYYRDLGI
jgi:hypothetical protein